jgi:phospholipid/cholesterol/gamma-HCH transport system substrate-binding protein
MNDATRRHSIVVGFFVLIGLAILTAGVLLLGHINRSLQSRIKVVSYFDDVNGLQRGNFVWFYGVRIGTVSGIHLKGADDVEVTMDIDSKIKQYIHKDSKVKLGSDGLIGNRILVIYGGTKESPTVEAGDILGYEKTLSTEDLMNTLQQNNENLKKITGNFAIISQKLAEGEGSMGKLLNDNSIYDKLNSAASSLQGASVKAQQLLGALSEYSAGLKKEGTLAYELTSDTLVFSSLRESVGKLSQIADTASLLINTLRSASDNQNTAIGVLLNDENTGADLKQTISNLKVSTEKLNEDLEGLQHSFPLKRYFRKKE